MRRHRFLAGVAFLAAFGVSVLAVPSGAAQQKDKEKAKAAPKPPVLPPDTQVHRDLTYGTHGERNTLDLYVPKSEKPLPLIIWVHGGGWQNGSKGGGGPAIGLLAKGYAVASINYRLSGQAIFPAQIEDCKTAVRFLRANAGKYNLNPDAFGAWGNSAGGHLVAMLGTTGDVKSLEGDGANKDVSSRVQAVCDFYGPADMTRFRTNEGATGTLGKLFGGNPAEKKELVRLASPVLHATKDDAPTLILQGDQDKVVPPEQSEFLLEALRKAGVECELVVVKENGHGGPGFSTPENREKIARFFDKHLKK